MGWVLFWIGVNFVVGYFIGKPKGIEIVSGVVSIFLGPIGWIIAAFSTSTVRDCPYCAEQVKREASVCRHCGHDLPRIRLGGAAPRPPRLSEKYDLSARRR